MADLPTTLTVLACALFTAGAARAQWSCDPASNLFVADAGGDQIQPRLAAADDGGCYVSWFDNRVGGYDVYLQRLDWQGYEQWPHNGILLADRGVSSTTDYDLITDAAGNAVIAYNDDGGSGGTQQIVVQKVDAGGVKLWGAAGVTVSTGTAFKASPQLALLSDGQIAVAWTGSLEWRMQKLDSGGAPQWTAGGLSVNEPNHYVGLCDIQAGREGGVIAAWMRGATTSGNSTKHFYAQMFDATGAPQWSGGNPVIVYNGSGFTSGYFPTFLPDGYGGAAFGFYEGGGSRNAYIQHVLADGSLRFGGAVASTGATPGWIRVGAGLAYDAVRDLYYLASPETDASTQTIYRTFVQRFDAGGARRWGDTGVTLIPTGTGNQPSFVQCVLRGDACAVYCIDSRSATTHVLFGAGVDTEGSVVWSNSPSPTAISKSRLTSLRNARGFSVLAWSNGASGGASNIQSQCLSAGGFFGVGNANGDTHINQDDLDLVLFHFGQSVPAGTNGDVDNDGDVDQDDLDLVLFTSNRC